LAIGLVMLDMATRRKKPTKAGASRPKTNGAPAGIAMPDGRSFLSLEG
jgi:hypothetical protein